ncbi:MAG: alkaline invertase [Limnothrix sp. CACIAM 69d]|nr:MAG: alkaline invertase [Limnothrix sp. CACIAM 69d]
MARFDSVQSIHHARHLLYDKSIVYCRDRPVGTFAALPQPRRDRPDAPPDPDLNYNEVFIRDNVPVMIYFLLDGRADLLRDFLDICLDLQSTDPQTEGIFPSSFYVEPNSQTLVADYGQRAIGRVSSVDASLWWPILAHVYVQRTGDWSWSQQPKVQEGIQRFLRLILHPWFRHAPTLYVPDGAFMIDRPLDVWGAPLEIQTLLYGALLSSVVLIHSDLKEKVIGSTAGSAALTDPFIRQQIWQLRYATALARRLRRYLLQHYWINGKTIQILRRRPTDQYGERVSNEYNIRTETIPHWLQAWLGDQGGYLIGNIRTGRPDFRFFSLGNCLGAIFDVLTFSQQRALFQLVLNNQADLFGEMPLRICHPPLDASDWRNKTGYDSKNRPWCYHNGGHWPCLLWYFVVAVLRHQQTSTTPYYRFGHLHESLWDCLQDAYQVLLKRLPEQKWPEYFDGPTGVWLGQEARLYQTWTFTGLLLVHHFLNKPADATVLDMPGLRSILSIEAQYQDLRWD